MEKIDRNRNPNWRQNLRTSYPNYGEWLSSLTEEQYQAHLLQRSQRKTMKQSVEAMVKQQQEQWAYNLENAAARVLQRAIENGDPQALATVWDRLVGKPKDTVEHTLAQEDTVEDIVSKLQAQSATMKTVDNNIINNTGDHDEEK